MGKIDNKTIPFPQANDFVKIFSIIEIEDENNLNDNEFLTNYLGVSPRQINYYLSACEFLDIIEKRRFTEFGAHIRSMGFDNKKATVAIKKLFLNQFLVKCFSCTIFYGEKMSIAEIAELIIFRYGNSMEKNCKKKSQHCKQLD